MAEYADVLLDTMMEELPTPAYMQERRIDHDNINNI
jgi:hypothetical protein